MPDMRRKRGRVMTIIEAVENFRKAWADFKEVFLETLYRDLHLTQILEWILRRVGREREGE